MTINITGTSSQYLRLNPLRPIWGVYAWLMLVLMLLAVALPVLILPRLAQRRSAARLVCRGYFLLCGLPVRVIGMDQLPPGPCIIVSNHASNIDGPLLFAALPPRFGFVVKKEAARIPLAGTLMRRLDHLFVDRFNRHEGANDVRRILRAVTRGNCVVFFPEGTIRPQPGLARFHAGAFVAAAHAGVPVAPIVIRGTRHLLRARTLLPRWSRIEVEALEPIITIPGVDTAASLRDAAHERIAAALADDPAA